MELVESDTRFDTVGTEEHHSPEQPEDDTDGVEDGRVLETEADVNRVMAPAAVCDVVANEATVVCSPLSEGGREGGREGGKQKI